jgi:hypothetical protein
LHKKQFNDFVVLEEEFLTIAFLFIIAK